jgi:hypothetical protein
MGKTPPAPAAAYAKGMMADSKFPLNARRRQIHRQLLGRVTERHEIWPLLACIGLHALFDLEFAASTSLVALSRAAQT